MDELQQPLVCICIPAYNVAATIAQTVESVLRQSYANMQVLVVDNQSTDATSDIVRRLADPRLTLHQNPVNIGAEGNFNRCIELASGTYTAIYHADDIYEPDMVAKQVAFLDAHPQAGAVFTEASLIDQFGRTIGAISQPPTLAVTGPLHDFPTVFKAILEHSNFLICPSVMARTEIYQQHVVGWRGELFGSSADLDVWLRILEKAPIGIIPEKTMRYRVSDSQWSANVRANTEQADFFKVIDFYLGKEQVRNGLSANDMANYLGLERRDRVVRAANALIDMQADKARSLCPDLWTPEALQSASSSRRGKVVLLLGLYIKLMLFLRLTSLAAATLRFAKQLMQK
jgi:glycosyltransferase involved in cell wall biosynthesis